MTHIGNRAGTRIRVLCPLACALALLFCASACGAASTVSGGSPGPAPSTGAAVSRRTPAPALTQWLRLLVRGDYRAACQDMFLPLGSIPTPVPVAANACSSKSSRVRAELALLHANFAIDGITPHTSITVATAHVTGTSATVRGTDIHISRTTLTSLMVAHSTRVQRGQVGISFTLSRARGIWYVTGMNMGL